MLLLVLYFLLAIVVSFLCSIWESVLLSTSDSFVALKAKEGSSTGLLLKKFKDPEHIDEPLAAILTLNTIAHTLGATGVGAQAATIWGEENAIEFLGLSLSAEFLVAAGMTLAILYLSEIIPKTLGAIYWRSLTGFTIRSIQFILIPLWPLVQLSLLITKMLKGKDRKSVFSRAELSVMAERGEAHGVVKKGESRIIRNLMRSHTIRTKDIMTPRTVALVAPEELNIQEFYDQHPNLRFSRIPVFSGNKDLVTGFVLKDEVLSSIIQQKGNHPLSSIRRPIQMANEYLPLPELYEQLLETREHIMLVVDEFGGMSGLVTMEDAIETLLGIEIIDEFDGVDDMQLWARKKWEQRARSLGILEKENLEKGKE